MDYLDERQRERTLRAFLASRRARLTPAGVGLSRAGGNHERGLLRQEVAELVGIPAEWYASFEDGTHEREFSLDFMQRIAIALRLNEEDRAELYRLARPATARLERGVSEGSTSSLWEIRTFSKKVAAASSFTDAAMLAVETSQHLVAPDALAVFSPREGSRNPAAYALGRRAKYWGRLSAQVAYDEHVSLPSATIAVCRNIVPPEDVREPQARVRVERVATSGTLTSAYEFSCDADRWYEINCVRVRSCLVASLSERGSYRGSLIAGWLEPRVFASGEIALFANLGAIVELAGTPGGKFGR